jgi:PAS domain-containing protein
VDKNDIRPRATSQLRQRAEERANVKAAPVPEQIDPLSPEEMQQILHELQVHQIELEIQNEELRRAQVELDAVRARYFDLYDLAPVGYCTLSEKGMITEANLTAATLLGVDRGTLVGQPMSRFVLIEDQDIYYRHHQQLFATMAPQVCQLRLLRPSNPPFWARLEAILVRENESGRLSAESYSVISPKTSGQMQLVRRASESRPPSPKASGRKQHLRKVN